MSHISLSPRYHGRTKDGWLTKVACGARTPIYLLWYWFLWFLACSIRKICCEEKWSIVHLHGKQSSTYRGSRFPPTDSFKHWEDSSVQERGPVQEIHCNRGTNFTSAKTELNRAIEEMDDKKIKADLLKANIAYIKNPVSASQFRGIWERQIRSIRNIMNSLMKEHGNCFIKYPWGRSCVKLSPQSTTGPGLWKHSMTLFWDCLYHQVFCWQERQGLCCLQLESLREKTLTVARNRDAHSI